MANILTTKANIWQGKYILYQEGISLDPGNTSQTDLEITLPNGKVLVVTKEGVATLTKSIEYWDANADAAYWAKIKIDLARWGWDYTPAASAYLCMINVEDLSNPDYYAGGSGATLFEYKDAEGFAVTFPVISDLYDGVYKLSASADVADAQTNPVETVEVTSRVMTSSIAETAIASYIEDYFEKHEDETVTIQEVNEIRDLNMKMIMLQYAARYDFSRGKYTAANEKVSALANIIDSGVFTFKPGS